MARRTSCVAAMPAVVEYCVKASDGRERLQSRRRMTDRAHGAGITGKLLCMTRRARDMSLPPDRGPIVIPNVADQTRHTPVLLRLVIESGAILVYLLELAFGHFERHEIRLSNRLFVHHAPLIYSAADTFRAEQ
jgi:hypothetical protein